MRLNIISISGGLGNQMFQYSLYLSLKYKIASEDFNYVFVAPYHYHNGYELNNVFNIKNYLLANLLIGILKKCLKTIVFKKRENPTLGPEQILIKYDKPIVYFSGFWQSEKYFINIQEIIRNTFMFKDRNINPLNKNLITELKLKNSVSIHVRRCDYVEDTGAKMILGGICELSYYIEAIRIISDMISEPYFYIFSDDIDWVKNNLSFLQNSSIVDWNRKRESWQDMMLMSKCKHNIIANSSFSWWGAWLNDNTEKIVIAPHKWFNTFNNSNIVPSNWIRIGQSKTS